MSLILDGTNGLSDVDGSAATPAIRGTDANTGIFFPAADTIAFAEGGAEAMRIDSSGNLGIGTASPQGRLEVNGVAYFTRGTKTFLINGNFGISDTHTQLQAPSGLALAFATNGDNERARIDSSGNFGIGTSSPTSQLHLAKALSSTQTNMLQIQNTGTFTWGIGVDNAVSNSSLLIQSGGAGKNMPVLVSPVAVIVGAAAEPAAAVNVPLITAVPATAKVLPAPTLRPTLVPVPAAAKIASTESRSVLILVPHVSVDAPTSGLVSNRFVVVESAIFCSF